MATIEVTDDMLDSLVIQSLKQDYLLCAKPDKMDHTDDFLDVDYELLHALDKVIRYYLSRDEYKEWLDSREKMIRGE